jgi:hypothetical protein
MFVPDLLHEFELGVWKAVFIHLMRILYAAGGDTIQTLNERYVNLRPTPIVLIYNLLDIVKSQRLDEIRSESSATTRQA